VEFIKGILHLWGTMLIKRFFITFVLVMILIIVGRGKQVVVRGPDFSGVNRKLAMLKINLCGRNIIMLEKDSTDWITSTFGSFGKGIKRPTGESVLPSEDSS
jgi:hypothetical protein